MRTIIWGDRRDSRDPIGNSRLSDLLLVVSDFRLGRLPTGWRGNQVFDNRDSELPNQAYGYYTEFLKGVFPEPGSQRVVLGQLGEVYMTGNHYRDFIRVLRLPVS